jgi:hypothetical protein
MHNFYAILNFFVFFFFSLLAKPLLEYSYLIYFLIYNLYTKTCSYDILMIFQILSVRQSEPSGWAYHKKMLLPLGNINILKLNLDVIS